MIGIDIGRVIISGDTDIPEQFFGEQYLKVPEVSGAIDSIKRIVHKFSPSKVFLVSKCGKIVQKRTISWLNHHDFFSKTGIIQDNIRFCLERHEKKAICEEIGISVFIDDRFTVLEHLLDLEKLYLFQPSNDEQTSFNACQNSQKSKIETVNNWIEIIEKLNL